MVETEQSPYSNNHYNDLQHIAIARYWNITESAIDLLKMFSTHNTQFLFGTCRLHRHFYLKEGECVVTEKINEDYISKVQSFINDLVPWQWKYNVVEKKWVAYEFAVVSLLQKEKFDLKIPQILCEVAHEFISSNFGDEGFEKIGLCLDLCKVYDDIRGESEDQMLMESTDDGNREQKSVFFEKTNFVTGRDTHTRWHQARNTDGCFRCCSSGCGDKHCY